MSPAAWLVKNRNRASICGCDRVTESRSDFPLWTIKKKNGQNILNKFSDCDLKEENSKSWALTFLPLGPLKTEAQQGQMQES